MGHDDVPQILGHGSAAEIDALLHEVEQELRIATMELLRAQVSEERSREIWRAMMLAPTLEICVALLKGESVPAHRLNEEWMEAFGMLRLVS